MAVFIDSASAPVCNRPDRPVALLSPPLNPGPDRGPPAGLILAVNQDGFVVPDRVIAAGPDRLRQAAVIPLLPLVRGLTSGIHAGRTASPPRPRA